MARITLDQANRIIAEAFAKAEELGLQPLGVAVLDPGAHLIAFQRQDGASNLRAAIAVGKANGALAFGVSSRRLGMIAAKQPHFVQAIQNLAPQGVLPAAGGIIVADAQANIVAAVGVSGDMSDNDEICAIAAIKACGLHPLGDPKG